jgi:hypothetical protein
VIMAIKLLLAELSPDGLVEVRRHLEGASR